MIKNEKKSGKREEKIIAVIPAFNEEKTIREVVRETKKHVDEVIVVDDASSDNTGKEAEKEGARVLRHVVNLGLGGTLKTGCEAALLLNANIIITLDADGQHDPSEIPKLVNKLTNTNLDIVFGERAFSKKMPFMKKLGNKFFNKFSKRLFNIRIKDTQTGFRAFTSEAYKKIKWSSRDYGVASEILINAEKYKINYAGKKVKTIYNDNYKGTTPIDGLKIANKMINLKINGRNE